ncbi:unnamed protein product, partial [Urochloa humidicola]
GLESDAATQKKARTRSHLSRVPPPSPPLSDPRAAACHWCSSSQIDDDDGRSPRPAGLRGWAAASTPAILLCSCECWQLLRRTAFGGAARMGGCFDAGDTTLLQGCWSSKTGAL